MSYKPSLWQKITSCIYPYNLEKVESEISGTLEVNLQYGTIVIDSPKANYSFGNLHIVFREALYAINLDLKKQHKVLVLGFGAGNIAHILYNEMHLNCSITGIELDIEMIELGKKYYAPNLFKRSKIIIADAFEYIKTQTETYDLILVDIFIDTKTPEKFQTEVFFEALKKALNTNGQILMNTMTENFLTKKNWEKTFKSNKYISVQENEVLHFKK